MPVIFRRPLISSFFIFTLLVVVLSASTATPAKAAGGPLIVSEVAPWSSGNSALAADWFEVTNTSSIAVVITGWKADDNSNSFVSGVLLNGITSIAPGESVLFIETNDPAAKAAFFRTLWFGASPPAGLQIGTYTGSGMGLSTGGDAVNLYDSTGTLQANVVFGASPAGPYPTFNNAVGLSNATISQLSVAGVNGAFAAVNSASEVGSPGTLGKLIVSEVAPWSSGNSPLAADWFEVTNTTASAVDVTGWKMDDSSNLFSSAVALNGIASIAPGESVIFIETANLATASLALKNLWFGANPPAGLQIGSYSGGGVGLSTGGDGVSLFNGSGVPEANVIFGASPAGPSFPTFNNAVGLNSATISLLSVASAGGAFLAANDANEVGSPGILGTGSVGIPPATTVKINEIESNGGVPGDWVEFYNSAASPVDLSGYLFKDGANTHVLPPGTSIPGNGYLVLEEVVLGVGSFNFGLGSVDSARLDAPGGVLVDSFSWLEHSSVTYGRCPNGTGAFTTALNLTKGAANACPAYLPWPGASAVLLADASGTFGENMSGLVYEASDNSTPGVLWAVRNNPETLFRLVWDSVNRIWHPDTSNDWSGGKQFRYMNGLGRPDAEGVTFAGNGPARGMYVATERDNGISNISRPSILRFDPTATGTELTATMEWNLTADLPPLLANFGLEAITWIPDTFLVSRGFFDEAMGHAYNPSEYPGHGAGLFFVGVENNGFVYGYALDHQLGGYTRIATVDSGFPGVMELQFDRELQTLWVTCDNTCEGRTHLFQIQSATGRFVVGQRYERPAGMPNLNNEGLAMASQAECVNNLKPVFWTDDGQTDGHAVRSGTVDCDDDADDDGFSNAAEIGSGGAQPNLLGSDPNNPASTPEACDGLDNDLNEGADEGFLDTDNDGVKNCMDPDDDNDGTPDTTDNCPQLSGPASRGGCPNACTVAVPAGYNVILGTNGNDTIVGTPGNDLIYAKDGNDTVNGNGGDDIVCSGKGNDRVVTGSGNDVIDTGEGNDTIDAGPGHNTVDSGEGNDRVTSGSGADWILTGDGNDDIQAGDGNNTINSGQGNGKVVTGSGNDWISTGEGNDDVHAGNGDNTVSTGEGNDKVTTGSGIDFISTGEGNDQVDGGLGFDTCDAGPGNNQVSNCEA